MRTWQVREQVLKTREQGLEQGLENTTRDMKVRGLETRTQDLGGLVTREQET